MNKPLLIAGLAVAVGLGAAATLLYVVKPQDRPLALPGSPVAEIVQDEPPLIITIGGAGAIERLHLIVGDDHVANQSAYRVFSEILAVNPDLGGNVAPAVGEAGAMRNAFAMVIAAGAEREALLDSLMGASGAISDSALTVIAQNTGLDVVALAQKAETPEVQDALEQARKVLPPATPAIYVGGKWLFGPDLSTNAVADALGRSDGTTQATNAPLVLENAYAFATPPKPDVAAIFLTLRNPGQDGAAVLSAETPVAGRVEMHETTMDDKGVMQMRRTGTVAVSPGQTIEFLPTGRHLMLFDLAGPLVVGQKFPITLTLENGQAISALVTVTPPGSPLNTKHNQEDTGSHDPALTHHHHSE